MQNVLQLRNKRHSINHGAWPAVRFYRHYQADEIKLKAAALAYYSFVSLFPLALFAMTVLNLLLPDHAAWAARFMKAITEIIPIIGTQFFRNLHYTRGIGAGLASELVLAALGVFGWIDAFQRTMNQVWHVIDEPPQRLAAKLKHGGLLLLVLLASVGTTVALFYGDLFVFHGNWLSVIALLVACVLNGLWFFGIFRLAISRRVPTRTFLPHALAVGVAVQLLARFGGAILSYELKHLSSLYGSFALVLGLLIWLYLLAQIILCASELAVMTQSNRL